MNKIFLFSGQGSQYLHMGKHAYETNSLFRYNLNRMDEYIKNNHGYSIISPYILSDSKEWLNQTKYSHPALFMIQYALYETLREGGVHPSHVLGISLGEFAAAAAAGVVDLYQAINMVVTQAIMIERLCEPGLLIAIAEDPSIYYKDPVLYLNSELAHAVGDQYFIISSTNSVLMDLEQHLSKNGLSYHKLPVGHAFHSKWIDQAEQPYKAFLRTIPLNKPAVSYYSSIYGHELKQIRTDYFWEVVRYRIDITKLLRDLSRTLTDCFYFDLGPTPSMLHLLKRLSPSIHHSKTIAVLPDLESRHNTTTIEEDNVLLTYMFPGQGSQYKGMGEELFDYFKDEVRQADEILGYSIKELCLYDPLNNLSKTNYTQPALYVVNCLSYMKKVLDTKRKPHYVLGHSLGEYSALFAAEVFDFITGLKLVKKRGELMAKISGGGMAAVIGLPYSDIRRIIDTNDLRNIDIANINSATQIVISGPIDEIEHGHTIFESAGAKLYLRLQVSGAFHSRYMQEAQHEFNGFIQTFPLKKPKINVISNVSGTPIEWHQLKEYMSLQLSNPVQWLSSIEYILNLGITNIEEIGPGRVLTKLLTSIRGEHIQGAGNPIEATKEMLPSMTGRSLGEATFKQEYRLKYAYLTGSMHYGISSVELVVKMGHAGMLGFFGSAELTIDQVEEAVISIQNQLTKNEPWGMNLDHNPSNPQLEEKLALLYCKYKVPVIEASNYYAISPALLIYKAKGIQKTAAGTIMTSNKVIAKVSRIEMAATFLKPAPTSLIRDLLNRGAITADEASLLSQVPVADEICAVEYDRNSTHGSLVPLLSSMIQLRNETVSKLGYQKPIRVGACGGVGNPETAAAYFLLGADFIMTGSINQCTLEAKTSDYVKDLLEKTRVQDIHWAPDPIGFETGSKIPVVKKGTLFSARASKLYEMYHLYDCIESISEREKVLLQEKYFRTSLDASYKTMNELNNSEEIALTEQDPKQMMALLFKGYLQRSAKSALYGNQNDAVNYSIRCGPSLGAFNDWVKGTEMESWRSRNVDRIGIKLMEDAAEFITTRFTSLFKPDRKS